MTMDDLLRFAGAVRRDPQIEAWFSQVSDPLRSTVRLWFDEMRRCGEDVLELLHDGCPVACVDDAPFGYVNAFKAHANVGFYQGATLPDPAGLLIGNGRRMRHVKLQTAGAVDSEALSDLISAAYDDIRQRLILSRRPPGTEIRTMQNQPRKVVADTDSPTLLIDARIQELNDWRGKTLALIRKLIKQADPEVVEQVKWRKPSNSMSGVPVWEHDGIICTGETYKTSVKLTFMKGAAIEDPAGLFNSSLDGNARRAIDFHEGDKINERAFKSLIKAAIACNTSKQPARSAKKSKKT